MNDCLHTFVILETIPAVMSNSIALLKGVAELLDFFVLDSGSAYIDRNLPILTRIFDKVITTTPSLLNDVFTKSNEIYYTWFISVIHTNRNRQLLETFLKINGTSPEIKMIFRFKSLLSDFRLGWQVNRRRKSGEFCKISFRWTCLRGCCFTSSE